MCGVRTLYYTLESDSPVAWNPSVESQLHAEYPFLNQEDTADNYVIRRYLETLWLPESLSPLSQLIHSLRRVEKQIPSGSSVQEMHPLHALLQPLLLSSRAASEKYRTELVQILVDGGGAGEQEEQMMWYAWNYEKGDENLEADDEKWRKCWLERLEKRETMIQILLNMLKISLPGPEPQSCSSEKAPEKHERKRKRKEDEPRPETTAERLESYMDKLSTWQLTSSLDDFVAGIDNGKQKPDRDWTQTFCEDVVECLFKELLPDECGLLRSKVFPAPVISDAEDSDTGSVISGSQSRANSRARSVSRQTSGLTPQVVGSKAGSRAPSIAPSQPERNTSGPLQRSRSRSLSISLIQDEENQRKNFVDSGKGLTRVLSREVNMSRVFKAKPKESKLDSKRQQKRSGTSMTVAKPKPDKGTTLIADTPIRTRTTSFSQTGASQNQFTQSLDPPIMTSPDLPILIEDTPVKSRTQSQIETQRTKMSPLSPLTSVLSTPQTERGSQSQSKSQTVDDDWLDENADDSFTGSFGSPDVLLLGDDRHLLSSPTKLGGTYGDASSPTITAVRTKGTRRSSKALLETPTKRGRNSKKL